MRKRVLVTGGAGYIGSVLVRLLVGEGFDVVVLDRCFWGDAHLGHLNGAVKVVRDDVRTFDPALLDHVEAVIHLAGLSNDPTADYNPTANWQMNVDGTVRIADACAARGLRLIFASSCALYDGLGSSRDSTEVDAVEGIGAYARSKAAAERYILELEQDYTPVILRQATAYGYSPRLRLDLVLNTFVRDALLHRELRLHGGGGVSRPVVGVLDLGRAYLACLRAPADLVSRQVFNVLEGNYAIRELAAIVAGEVERLRPDGPVRIVDVAPQRRMRDYRCSGEKARSILGLWYEQTPARSIDELVACLSRMSPAAIYSPRHYNIEWMTALERAAASTDPRISIWDAPTPTKNGDGNLTAPFGIRGQALGTS